ncbi:excinuclease ABC subunit UvrC [Alphaproteobacteria bacterium]|nr:excinuclease ABC subunit UvrC [Alphaproteobacteria bacterium]
MLQPPLDSRSVPISENPKIIAEVLLIGAALIDSKVATLPSGPGVYRMLDEHGEALYVGKAKNLKNRVRSYTRATGHNNRILKMIDSTRAMEFIRTETETDALLLEANLIKKLKPRYNVLLRDDKSFPYILLADDHAVPQLYKHRGARKRTGAYFGPFASAGAVNRTLNTLQRAFLLRSCSDSVYESRTRPCLLYQIKRCSAPCTDEISADDYGLLVEEARQFLKGDSRAVQNSLLVQMQSASDAMDFEGAASARDRIRALTYVQQESGINHMDIGEADVIAIAHEGGQSCVQVFFFRAGQNLGNRAYFPRHDKDQSTEEILEAFIGQFYDNRPVPQQIMVSHKLEARALLEQAMSLRMEQSVKISQPQRGSKVSLVKHATQNAREALARNVAEGASQRRLLRGVGEAFDLDSAPQRIEVFDNSHLQGTNQLGGMVVAGPDGFLKNQYRKFSIRDETTTPGDDYAMMREVFTRRYGRLAREEAKGSNQWPDLVLIDGGRGQLNIAAGVMDELGLEDIPLVGVAKGPDRDAGRERFFMRRRDDFMLPHNSPVLYYLQRLRDEAHRFAIGGHRAKRKSDIRKNPLDQIAGIGAGRKKALLHHFGSARAVERASLGDLEKVEGISDKIALKIYHHFNNDGAD